VEACVCESILANGYSFFEEAVRIAAPEYIPTEADVLRARTKTTGIYETRFTMGQLSIQYVKNKHTEALLS
jgi:guanine nucleotide-binding protein G(i) subunit alpha